MNTDRASSPVSISFALVRVFTIAVNLRRQISPYRHFDFFLIAALLLELQRSIGSRELCQLRKESWSSGGVRQTVYPRSRQVIGKFCRQLTRFRNVAGKSLSSRSFAEHLSKPSRRLPEAQRSFCRRCLRHVYNLSITCLQAFPKVFHLFF